jgi:predicted dehydrogenase
MALTRCAVIGVGYLGAFHAQKYAALPNAELVAVADANPDQAAKVAENCQCKAVTDYTTLFDQVDAVSIAVPTRMHFEVAREFLKRGIHVLLEKPITVTVEEAAELNRLARDHKAIFQIGHLERFNPALMMLANRDMAPRFIESHRLAPFKPRGADVNVVLDLMIHDVDIILNLVQSKVTHIDANGASVLSQAIDIANARIEFENGCVANVTSSRVSLKTERKMRIFQQHAYIAVDFQTRGLSVHRVGDREMFPGIPEITSEESFFDESDALKAEIISFLSAIQQGTPIVVSGEDGQRALETAIRITDLVHQKSHSLR